MFVVLVAIYLPTIEENTLVILYLKHQLSFEPIPKPNCLLQKCKFLFGQFIMNALTKSRKERSICVEICSGCNPFHLIAIYSILIVLHLEIQTQNIRQLESITQHIIIVSNEVSKAKGIRTLRLIIQL